MTLDECAKDLNGRKEEIDTYYDDQTVRSICPNCGYDLVYKQDSQHYPTILPIWSGPRDYYKKT